jgi:hypothetical protein
MGKLHILLLRIFASISAEKEKRNLTRMLRRILIAGWVSIFGSMVLLAIFPRLALLIPHPELIRLFLVLFVLISFVYGIVTLYRLGMKRARGG